MNKAANMNSEDPDFKIFCSPSSKFSVLLVRLIKEIHMFKLRVAKLIFATISDPKKPNNEIIFTGNVIFPLAQIIYVNYLSEHVDYKKSVSFSGI